MKEFKKILCLGIIIFVGATGIVHADTFDYSGELFSKIEDAVLGSAQIFSKPKGLRRDGEIVKICDDRIGYLQKAFERCKVNVPGFLGSHATSYGLRGSGYEISRLRRSKTWVELQHNIGSGITVYENLKKKVDSPEDSKDSDSESSEAARPRKKQFMTTRENRKDWRSGGRGRK